MEIGSAMPGKMPRRDQTASLKYMVFGRAPNLPEWHAQRGKIQGLGGEAPQSHTANKQL